MKQKNTPFKPIPVKITKLKFDCYNIQMSQNNNYTVLIQGDDVSSMIAFDDDFNKLPFKEWDKLENIIKEFLNNK